MTLRDLFDEFEPLNSTFYDYEEEAMNHAVYDEDIIYPALGLVSEAGEVADKIKKAMRDEGWKSHSTSTPTNVEPSRRNLATYSGTSLPSLAIWATPSKTSPP